MAEHEKVFEAAWGNAAYTRCELPPVDVNRVLEERYELARPLVFTRTMLWDMEVRKARRPDLYIPYVVLPGSADAWGDGDTFVRRSEQRLWLEPETYGLVLELTHLDHAEQKVTFVGASEHPDQDGRPLTAGTGQPLFHVEHAVGGEEERPLNLWRIVHLTDGPDDRLVALFEQIAKSPSLPEFIEIYIRDVLGIGLQTRQGR